MRSPAFWYQPPGQEAKLLAPLSCLYRAGANARRALATPYGWSVPVICVGGIVVGGSGKTPTVIALAQMLKQDGRKPVIVMRGYGGSEKGPLKVDLAKHTAREVGDEALLLARVAPVYIGRDRVAAIRITDKDASHILLDDGLQNPYVQPHLAFLAVDAEVGFGNGHVLPAGPLRETYQDAAPRIGAVVIIGETDTQNIAASAGKPVVRAHYAPRLPDNFPRAEKFFAFAGIARPGKFYQTCHAAGLTLAGTRDFPDHHFFGEDDLEVLKNDAAETGARLLTTEKDWVRLSQNLRAEILALPVDLIFEDPVTVKRLLAALPAKG